MATPVSKPKTGAIAEQGPIRKRKHSGSAKRPAGKRPPGPSGKGKGKGY